MSHVKKDRCPFSNLFRYAAYREYVGDLEQHVSEFALQEGSPGRNGGFLGLLSMLPLASQPHETTNSIIPKECKVFFKIRWGGWFFVGRDRSFVLFFVQLKNPPKTRGLVQVMVEAFWLSCNKPSRMIRWLLKQHYDPVGLECSPGSAFCKCITIPNSSGVWKAAPKHFANPDGFHPSGHGRGFCQFFFGTFFGLWHIFF